jgi:hypothetical protein
VNLTRTNVLVAAGIQAANSIVPFLVIVGAVSWTSEAVAASAYVVTSFGTFIGLLFASTPATNVPDA